MPSVDVGVISQFFHPPIGLCALSALAGHYGAGQWTLTRPAGPVGVDAFGVMYSVLTEPVGVGSVVGGVTTFEDRVCQLAVRHTMLSGELVITQLVEGFADSELVMFTEAIPHSVLATVTTGFSVDFFWVLLL